MSDRNKTDLGTARRILEIPARLQLAAAGLRLDRSAHSWIDQWIATALPAAELVATRGAVACGVSLDASTGGFGLETSGARERVTGRLDRFFADCAADEEDRAQLARAVERLAPATLGYSTELCGDEVAGGWFIPGERALADALELAPRTRAAAALAAWAEQRGVARAVRVGRALGGGNTFSEIVLSVGAPLEAALESFVALDVAAPAPETLAAVQAALVPAGARHPMRLRVWLTGTGVSRLGIELPGEDLDVVPALHRLLKGLPVTLETVAAFEGALGAERADWLEIGALGRRANVALHYRVGAG